MLPTRTQLAQRLSNLQELIRHPDQLNQAGQTPFEIIAEAGIARLRHYPAPAGVDTRGKQPIVIVPPLAVNMYIYDLFPQRSLVATLRDQGYPLYLIDWGRPGRREAHYTMATYLQDFMPRLLTQVRAHSGQHKLTLHGWSIGAMFSYAYAALGDPDIDRLVLIGPPCDYHAPNMQNRHLAKPLKALQERTGWRVDKSPQALWHVPGWVNALGFKLMSPAGTLRGYAELLRNLDDRRYISAHATNAAFLDDMVAYPGGVTQDMIRFLITENVLAQGRLPIRGCDASLASITARVLIVVGDKDPIITPQASGKLIGLMKQAHCEMIQVPGGHMSIVSGSQAPRHIWPQVSAWLDGKSAASAAPV